MKIVPCISKRSFAKKKNHSVQKRLFYNCIFSFYEIFHLHNFLRNRIMGQKQFARTFFSDFNNMK